MKKKFYWRKKTWKNYGNINLPNHTGDFSAGKVLKTPTNAKDIVNKEYVDESGGSDTKVAVDSDATAGYLGANSNDGILRTGAPLTYTDGGNYVTLGVDETAINHDALTNFSANEHKDHTAISVIAGTNMTGGGDISSSRTLNVALTEGTNVTGDHGTGSTDEIVNVCYGTGTPPTANTTTIGTLWIKYTA